MDKFSQVDQGMDGLKKAFGDGEPSQDDEPDEVEKEAVDSVSSGTSSGKGEPGEMRDAPGDVRFDTQKAMVDPKMRVAQHKLDEEHVAELEKSMRGKGYDPKYPLLIVMMKNGQHAVLDGHHKGEAAIRAGIASVPAYALTQDQLVALLLLKFGGGLPKKMRKMDKFIYADGVPYTEKREKNSNRVSGKKASSVTK